MSYLKRLIAVLTITVFSMAFAKANQPLTVGYFLEWPTANQVAQVQKIYDETLGIEVKWRAFENGNDMTDALVSGDINIAFSQGIVPFVIGVTNGAPIKMIGVAVTYSENDLCIIRDDAAIDKENAKELEGKKVATTIGNVSYHRFLGMMKHLGVDVSKIEIVEKNPADSAVALVRGDVVMACGFGGAITRMQTVGRPLMSGEELEEIGLSAFDIIAVSNSYAIENPEIIEQFLAITHDMNAAFLADPKASYDILADAAGMDLEDAIDMIENFKYITPEAQLSSQWMDGGIQTYAKDIAEFMKENGRLETTLESYNSYIDDQYLR